MREIIILQESLVLLMKAMQTGYRTSSSELEPRKQYVARLKYDGGGRAASVKTEMVEFRKPNIVSTSTLPVRIAFNSQVQSKLGFHDPSHLETMSSSLRTPTFEDTDTEQLCDFQEGNREFGAAHGAQPRLESTRIEKQG